MAGKAGLRAGLIGLAVVVVWTVITRLIPAMAQGVLMYASCAISSLMYVGTGVLAGLFLGSPRTAGKGAGAGAISGLIAGGGGAILGIVIMLIQVSTSGTIPGLNPEQAQLLAESNIDPTLLFTIGGVCGGALSLGVAAGFGAGGGAIAAAIKGD